MNRKWKAVICVLLVVAGAAYALASYRVRVVAENEIALQASVARQEAGPIQEHVIHFSDSVVPARLPFQAVLLSLGIPPSDSARLVAAAQSVFDLRHLRAGNRLRGGRSAFGELREIS
jgi:hypothetical protein